MKFKDECPRQIRILPGDMSDFSLAQMAVDLALNEFGQLNGLIINHGTMGQVDKIENCSINGWREVFDVNFFSAVAFVSVLRPSKAFLMARSRRKLRCQPCERRAVVSSSHLQVPPQGLTAPGGLTVLRRPQ